MIVIKRNGSEVIYNNEKIKSAVNKAVNSVNKHIADEQMKNIINSIEKKIIDSLTELKKIHVEDIQDIVENQLIKQGWSDVAKSYILYRKKHEEQREASQQLMEKYQELLFADSKNVDLKRDNANINTDAPMGIMLKLGVEGAKCYADYYALPEKYAEADKEKFIHIHENVVA